MASNENANIGFSVEKLKGRENYSDWKFQISALLKLDGLWSCISQQWDTLVDASTKARREEKALSKIILSLDKSTYPHVMQATTASEAWKSLEKAFEDKGLHRRLTLLKSLCSIKLENFGTMEEYVNEVMAVSQQLISMGKPIDDEFLGVIMLQGLTADYEPMVMALENSGVEITSDFVKTKLLQDKKYQNGKHASDCALAMKKSRKPPWCWNCKQKGHYKNQCPRSEQSSSSSKVENTSKNGRKALFVAALSANSVHDTAWYIDSGASSHMTGNSKLLFNLTDEDLGQDVFVANNSKLTVSGTGSSIVKLKQHGTEQSISKIKYVPNLAVNLLSVNEMVSKGHCVHFDLEGCKIINGDDCVIKGEAVATAANVGGLYKLDVREEFVNVVQSSDSQMLWHRRLGHLNHHSMALLKNSLATGVLFKESKTPEYCESCIKGKQSRKPFPYKKDKQVAQNKLDLIHSDLAGPMDVESWGGKKYMFTFIDDSTRKVFCYFLENKSEVPEIFKTFCLMVENQTDRKIKVLRTDNGGEYCNERLRNFLQSRGIKHELTVPYTPEQNGVAERYNRTILEKVRSMLADSNSQKQMWAEAANTAVYLLNRSPAKKIRGATPEEKWIGKKVDLKHLRVFGCRAYAHIPNAKRKKLDDKSKEYIFVGYSETSVGYRLLDPNNYSLKIARDVVFLEDKLSDGSSRISTAPTTPEVIPLKLSEDSDGDDNSAAAEGPHLQEENPAEETSEVSVSEDENSASESTSESASESENQESRYPTRVKRQPDRYGDCITNYDSDFAMLIVSDDLEPITISEALSSARSDEWRKAMKSELEAFKSNNAWELVDKPSNKNIVKNKWVFKIKRDHNGDIVTYKARLVAKGFTQKYGVDYSETFSPVIRFTNLRLLLAMTVELDLEADHLDVETAFLNGDIDEQIFMTQPEGFIEPGSENKVCLLKKAVYGLKQSAKLWYEKAHNVLLELNFVQSKIEPCIFFKNFADSLIIIALYVDDFFVFYSNHQEAKTLKIELKKHFHIKDLGPISNILGIKVARNRSRGELKISQEQYIKKVLDRFEMSNCGTVNSPLEQNQKFSVAGEFVDVPYQQLIGSIMYLSVCTRPDISFSVSFLSQFNNTHTKEHWVGAKRVLKYLKGTKDMGIIFKKSNNPVTGFVDADWANNESDRKSFYGYIFMLAEGPISWECQKQKSIALSSTEAEYIGICEAVKESMYIKSLCVEIFSENSSKYSFLNLQMPMVIFNDNQSAIKLTENQVFHKRTKHIHVKYHFIRDKVKNKDIKLLYMPTNEMVADMLTKSLGGKKHQFVCSKLNLE